MIETEWYTITYKYNLKCQQSSRPFHPDAKYCSPILFGESHTQYSDVTPTPENCVIGVIRSMNSTYKMFYQSIGKSYILWIKLSTNNISTYLIIIIKPKLHIATALNPTDTYIFFLNLNWTLKKKDTAKKKYWNKIKRYFKNLKLKHGP